MSAIQWEYDLVERPFCEQLKGMGWQWIEGDTQVPEFTERASFREVWLRGRLAEALRRINLRDGEPWLDETRIEKAIRDLEQAGGHGLMESNQAVTELLLKGTVVDGMPGWNYGRPQPVRYLAFGDEWSLNDFLVINQFKASLGSGRGHVIPDSVLFVNGLPLVVAEFKSPGIEGPIQQAIDQLLRYSNQRREVFPTLYQENEGVERLFHTNQLLIASDFFEARVATVGAPPEDYLEWADSSPVPLSQVAEETGVIAPSGSLDEAARLLADGGPEQGERPGTPLFFREGEDKPAFVEKGLNSQQILVAGMLRPQHLMDLLRNFILFQQARGRTRKVVARYQQFRAVHSAIHRLCEGRSRIQNPERDERGGLIWHTQGSGKSLTMVFLIRKMRTIARLKAFKIVVVTDRTDLQKQIGETAGLTGEAVRPTDADLRGRESPTELTHRLLSDPTPDIVLAMLQKYQTHGGSGEDSVEMTIVRKERKPGKGTEIVEREVTLTENLRVADFPLLNDSADILILVDEAHRGHTRALRRNLLKALPNAAGIGFTGTPILGKDKRDTREIFGAELDRYLLRDAELDGATVPILYEGRTADGLVEQADKLDRVFEDMFRGYSERELATIKAKYATDGDVMEAPMLIERKARDMIRHYASVVLPEGYKAQVVATSRRAVMVYLEKLVKARNELVADLESLNPGLFTLPESELEKHGEHIRFLLSIHPQLSKLRAMEFAAAFSENHNDPESWKDWTDKEKQEALIGRFKRTWGETPTDKTDPLSILVVMNMLLTGFDAPVEQVLYLDRKIIAHDLLQAIARVNRTCGPKRCGYVVDYIGVARHLAEALEGYDAPDTTGAMLDIAKELPALLDLRARAVAVFTSRGVSDLKLEVTRCVNLLEDLRVRAEFIGRLRRFYQKLGELEHRPEVPPDVFRDAKLLGFINKAAANLYRDPALNLLGVAERVKALIDAHISARGIDPKIPPVAITDADFEKMLAKEGDAKGRAAQMKHAARFHIVSFSSRNPQFAKKMSERLEEILKRFKDDWDALERELRELVNRLRDGDRADFPDLDADAQVPFVRLVIDECDAAGQWTDERRQAALAATLDMVERIKQEVRKVGFWKNKDMREILTRALKRDIDTAGLAAGAAARELAQKMVELARENHEALTRP